MMHSLYWHVQDGFQLSVLRVSFLHIPRWAKEAFAEDPHKIHGAKVILGRKYFIVTLVYFVVWQLVDNCLMIPTSAGKKSYCKRFSKIFPSRLFQDILLSDLQKRWKAFFTQMQPND